MITQFIYYSIQIIDKIFHFSRPLSNSLFEWKEKVKGKKLKEKNVKEMKVGEKWEERKMIL